MLAFLPAAALAAASLALVSRGIEWRKAFLYGSLGCAGIVWASTEGLSLFAALGRAPIGVIWSIAGVAAAAAIRPRRLLAPHLAGRPFLVFVGAAVFAVMAATFCSAAFGAPSITDAMTYHLPRIIFWEQHGTLAFYPTSQYQQLSMQPFSEEVMLHLYTLAGGDRYAQLAQWWGFGLCIIAVSLLAKKLGAGVRGQAAAALLCATLPSGVLHASGAKPGVLMAGWLATALALAYPSPQGRFGLSNAIASGMAVGLALFTKGTAYVFAPVLGVAVWASLTKDDRLSAMRLGPVLVALAILINAPLYLRNWEYNAHLLGDGSAGGGSGARYANDRFGPDVTVSNLLRNAALQIPFRESINRTIYEAVVAVHVRLGIDAQDRATTIGNTEYAPALVLNHERVAANVRHTLLLAPAALWLIWRRRVDRVFWISVGVAASFTAFCAVFKWQPWNARMHLPLYVIACVPLAVFLDSLRPRWLLWAASGWLVWNVYPALADNMLRPLASSRSVFRVVRPEAYFFDWPRLGPSHSLGADWILRSGCQDVGVDASRTSFQYPLMALLREKDPEIRFEHEGVLNDSTRYRDVRSFDEPCAVLCIDCADDPAARKRYQSLGPPAQIDDLLIFVRALRVNPVLPGNLHHYDASNDGQRFLIDVAAEQGEGAPVTVVLNWQAELER